MHGVRRAGTYNGVYRVLLKVFFKKLYRGFNPAYARVRHKEATADCHHKALFPALALSVYHIYLSLAGGFSGKPAVNAVNLCDRALYNFCLLGDIGL